MGGIMVEYALITAGSALMPLRLQAERLIGSISLVDAVLIGAGIWVLWRIVDLLIGPRSS